MSDQKPAGTRDSIEEYARKMDAFMDGPTTTTFQQLLDKGIELPAPDAVTEADLHDKLWEVIAGLAELRTFLTHSDHLTDRQLYTKLWNETLREETPAIDEIGFSSHVDLLPIYDDDTLVQYLKWYADEEDREHWRPELDEAPMPEHEDPPCDRDVLLPNTMSDPDAAAWLRAHPGPHAFATNRFRTTAEALAFVEQLYAAGAGAVAVQDITFLPQRDWTPYSDTLRVKLPTDEAQRARVFELIDEVGRPDEGDTPEPPHDTGQEWVRLWWD